MEYTDVCKHRYSDTHNTNKSNNIILILLILLLIVFILGIIGFRYFFEFGWIDAFYNACMSTSTLGLGHNCGVKSDGQKLFVSIYALVAGVLFISIISYVVVRVVEHYDNK